MAIRHDKSPTRSDGENVKDKERVQLDEGNGRESVPTPKYRFRKIMTIILITTGMVCWCGCLAKQTYSGRVVDTVTGDPISGATIEVTYYERGRFAPSLDGWFLRKPVNISTVTDIQGNFIIRAGRHHLDFWVAGPPDSKSYRNSAIWWRVDEDNPNNLVIRLGKSKEYAEQSE